ncbi:uncharacterized protein LODBEIA_P10540 [Lodderomyces beijingensis]|uniref:Uncharacterized protein n=1 Tax=Lodderomyces beijingensis TaxID=1775926 RepID=A0ABP0ZI58_9ASCO
MSEQVDKFTNEAQKVADKVKEHVPTTSKKFDSKSLQHLNSYSLVKEVEKFTLSFSLINSFYTRFFLPIYQFITINLLSVSPIYDVATFFDQFTNGLLSIFDKYAIDAPLETLDTVNKSYVTPVNKKIIEVNNQYLVPVKIEAEDSVFQVYYTVKNILLKLKDNAFSKSNEIQKNLVDTYNKELSSASPDQTVIGKNLLASYNTGYKAFQTINDDYLTPLKKQTEDFVANGQKKAESLLNNTKQKIEPKLNEYNEKKDELLNGQSAPVVSASA